ncbi:MAG: YqgE/AlgH family protein [Rhodospirillales bacterium]|nr:YqgE/AlgH family protein [Rhodospirillales bacterium]
MRGLYGWAGLFCLLGFLLPGPAQSRDQNLTGKFLIATRQLNDRNFSRTVVFICNHDEKGALGLVLNHPMGQLPFSQLLKQFGIEVKEDSKIPVRSGGPVQRNLAVILHTPDVLAGEPLCNTGKGAITATIDMLKLMAQDKGPKWSRIFFGYSGWGAGQLEREIQQKSWDTIPWNEELLFDEDTKGMWEKAKRLLGVEL